MTIDPHVYLARSLYTSNTLTYILYLKLEQRPGREAKPKLAGKTSRRESSSYQDCSDFEGRK